MDSKIAIILKENDVNPLRAELYYQFIKRLTETVFNTYAGDDVMSEDSYRGHFDWCFQVVDTEFDLWNLDFKSRILMDYLYDYFHKIFYTIEIKTSKTEIDFLSMWHDTFHDLEKLINLLVFVDIYSKMESIFSVKSLIN